MHFSHLYLFSESNLDTLKVSLIDWSKVDSSGMLMAENGLYVIDLWSQLAHSTTERLIPVNRASITLGFAEKY